MRRALGGAAGLAAAATMTMGMAPGAYASCGGSTALGRGAVGHHSAVVRHHDAVPASTHRVWRWEYRDETPEVPAVSHDEWLWHVDVVAVTHQYQYSKVINPTHEEYRYSRVVPELTHTESKWQRWVEQYKFGHKIHHDATYKTETASTDTDQPPTGDGWAPAGEVTHPGTSDTYHTEWTWTKVIPGTQAEYQDTTADTPPDGRPWTPIGQELDNSGGGGYAYVQHQTGVVRYRSTPDWNGVVGGDDQGNGWVRDSSQDKYIYHWRLAGTDDTTVTSGYSATAPGAGYVRNDSSAEWVSNHDGTPDTYTWNWSRSVVDQPAYDTTETKWFLSEDDAPDGWFYLGRGYPHDALHAQRVWTRDNPDGSSVRPDGDGWFFLGHSSPIVDSPAYTAYYTGEPGGTTDESQAAWVTYVPSDGWSQADERTVQDPSYTEYYTGKPGGSTSADDAAWVTYVPSGGWTESNQRTVLDQENATTVTSDRWSAEVPDTKLDWAKVDGSRETVTDAAAVPAKALVVKSSGLSASAPDASHDWVRVPGSVKTVVDSRGRPAHDAVVRPARDVTARAGHGTAAKCDPADDPQAAADPSTGTLPNTGGPGEWQLLAGAGLVAAGAVLVLRRRRVDG